MPLIEANGIRHFYRVDGRDDRPAVMFAHSLGCDHSQWDPQAAALEADLRIIRYDLRGHGATDVTPGEYSIEKLGQDALALAGALGVGRFAFCGLSLGGMIGQWLAANEPDRITHLALANTSAQFPDPGPMETRRRTVLQEGMPAVVDAVLGRFFTPERLAANPPFVANIRRIVLATRPAGYAGCCAAVRDLRQTGLLSSIRQPALIVVGDRDQSTPWEPHGRTLAEGIPHARVVHLPAAHLSNLEEPAAFTQALRDLLAPGARLS